MLRQSEEKLIQCAIDNEFTELHGKKYLPKDRSNLRNGTTTKNVKCKNGILNLKIPRGRKANFSPAILPKHSREFGNNISDAVMGMFSRGMTLDGIKEFFEKEYGTKVSVSSLSNIINKTIEDMYQWLNRPLKKDYAVLQIDGIVFSVKGDRKSTNKSAHIILGIDKEGHKEIISVSIKTNETAKSWEEELLNLKARGVENVAIICSDGLSGIDKSISAVFPNAMHQRCIVHLMRNIAAKVSDKDMKEIKDDLKKIIYADTEKEAYDCLISAKKKTYNGRTKYWGIYRSWEKIWTTIRPMYQVVPELRKIIYTTNPIESVNSIIRTRTTQRRFFQNDTSLLKNLYFILSKLNDKWNRPLKVWDLIKPHIDDYFHMLPVNQV
jgi:transposase-like protein